MTNENFRLLLKQYPRLCDWYEIGPVQRAELEGFVNSVIQAGMVAVTADGELVSPGDQVWALSSTGKIEPTTVQIPKARTYYSLFGDIPVSSSWSTKEFAERYKRDAHDTSTNS